MEKLDYKLGQLLVITKNNFGNRKKHFRIIAELLPDKRYKIWRPKRQTYCSIEYARMNYFYECL
jgi:hypothetical protein